MKKLLLVLALLAGPVLGQAVDSDHIKKKTNGGLTGDSAKALTVAPYRGTSAPGTPLAGQLWCDTTTSPCVMKTYNGSTWETPVGTPAISTQADSTSFPSSPSDGQMFFSKSPAAIYVYNATNSTWYYAPWPMTPTGAALADAYNAATIADATTAPTAATSATAGSTSAGNYSYVYGFVNATGGETLSSSRSNTVAPGLNKSNDLTGILAGGSGTTARRVYRSKTGQDATGPWYYCATIADNSTTTLHDGVSDASLLAVAPSLNYSGAPPGAWTYNATASNIVGGCGTTTRSTLACASVSVIKVSNNSSNVSDAGGGRGQVSIAAYTSGNMTIQYRITQLSRMADSIVNVVSPCYFGLRNGTVDNAIRITECVGFGDNGAGITVTLPFSTSNHPSFRGSQRSAIAGAATHFDLGNTFPQIDALPFWVRAVKRSTCWNTYVSADGVTWQQRSSGVGVNNSTCASAWTVIGNTATDTLELPIGLYGAGTTVQQTWIEIDNFTLTVN